MAVRYFRSTLNTVPIHGAIDEHGHALIAVQPLFRQVGMVIGSQYSKMESVYREHAFPRLDIQVPMRSTRKQRISYVDPRAVQIWLANVHRPRCTPETRVRLNLLDAHFAEHGPQLILDQVVLQTTTTFHNDL